MQLLVLLKNNYYPRVPLAGKRASDIQIFFLKPEEFQENNLSNYYFQLIPDLTAFPFGNLNSFTDVGTRFRSAKCRFDRDNGVEGTSQETQ